MKKAFDQTVRDLKRGVNKKVLKVPGIEQKILDATSNEPWGPHGSHLAEIAQATRNYHEYQIIMNVIWKRINDTGKNWRHVYKALTVLEYLVAHGSERVIEEIKEHAYQISTLSNFQYIDSSGRDQGSNVRRKSQNLVALVNDKERVQEVRQKANANKDKYRSSTSPGGAYRTSSYSGTGGYVDRYDDDRYGYKDDDRNGNGRERDYGYRDDERYGRGGDSHNRDGDGDRYGRDNEDRYGRDGYGDDDYRGRDNDGYQPGSRSVDRYSVRSLDDDDRHSTRSGGTKGDDHSQSDRRLEHQHSESNVVAPPSYEEAIRDARSPVHNERNGVAFTSPTHKSSSPPEPKATSPSISVSQGPENIMSAEFERAPHKKVDAFDEFDPRGSVSAATPVQSSTEFDFFGDLSAAESTNSLALMPVDSAPTPSEGMPTNSGFGVGVPAPSMPSAVSSQPYENPFGDSPFKATPDGDFAAQPQNIAPGSSFQPSGSIGTSEPFPPVASNVETVQGFDIGDTFGGLTYNPSSLNDQHSFAHPAFLAQGMQPTSSDVLDDFLPQTGSTMQMSSESTLPAPTPNVQTAQMNFLPEPGLSAAVPQQATPISSQYAQLTGPNSMRPTQLNLQQGLPAPVSLPSQTALTLSQAAQPTPPNNNQSARVGVQPSGVSTTTLYSFAYPNSLQAAQPTALCNVQSDHVNPLQQPGVSAPAPLPSSVSPFYTSQLAPANSMHAAALNIQQQPGVSVPLASQAAALNIQQQPGVSVPLASQAAPANSAVQPAKVQSSKFETKSTVWADTLNRGLVDLNISGAKINPLADIGIDFDSINRKEKRKEVKSSAAPVVSAITMGKAMGSGSGIGRAGGGNLAAPPNPMMSSGTGMVGGVGMSMGAGTSMGLGMGMSGGGGMGMGGYGGGMNQPSMGMGMNMGMGMGMGMNMGMGQGGQMRPPFGMPPPGAGMPGIGYNPMTGMGNYGSQPPYGGGPQQSYGGGYR